MQLHPQLNYFLLSFTGKEKAGMVHSVNGERGRCRWNWDLLRKPTIPARLKGVFRTMRYTSPRLPYLILLYQFRWKVLVNNYDLLQQITNAKLSRALTRVQRSAARVGGKVISRSRPRPTEYKLIFHACRLRFPFHLQIEMITCTAIYHTYWLERKLLRTLGRSGAFHIQRISWSNIADCISLISRCSFLQLWCCAVKWYSGRKTVQHHWSNSDR